VKLVRGTRVRIESRWEPRTNGLTGVVFRRTSGHYNTHVWLDRPHHYTLGTGHRRERGIGYAYAFNDKDVVALEDQTPPRLRVEPPGLDVKLKGFMVFLNSGRLVVMDGDTLLGVARGAARAHGMVSRVERMERRAAAQS
jgi:hypothetical protein